MERNDTWIAARGVRCAYPLTVYQALLARRYLTTKIMPLLASVAVLLCTAMVLITWSVMGGFLGMLIGSGRTLVGDVVIGWPGPGFGHYEDLIARLQADPEIEAATPVIETYAYVTSPDGTRQGVLLKGIDGPSYAKVTKYADTLWWKPLAEPLEKDKQREDPRVDPRLANMMTRVLEQGLTLTRTNPTTGEKEPAVVPGIEFTGFNRRNPAGFYLPKTRQRPRADGTVENIDTFLPRDGYLTIGVAPLDASGKAIDLVNTKVAVANEFQSGVYEVDSRCMFIQLDALQKMLSMSKASKVERRSKDPFQIEETPDGRGERYVEVNKVIGESPARVTHVLVRGKGDLSKKGAAARLRDRCGAIYADFAAAHAGQVPDAFDIQLQTWEDLNRVMISAVEHERLLVLFIFSFISLTAVFLVLAIFWSMISEKTRDIGILRAIGASRLGVASVWLWYAFAIGVVGAALGVLVAYLVVVNINPIHEWLGDRLGIVIWDPRVYYFVKIPNQVGTRSAIVVFFVGVMSSVLGAAWPAIRAAWMNPVRALRFE